MNKYMVTNNDFQKYEKYSNAFTEELQDLVVLGSQDIVNSHVTETIFNIAKYGKNKSKHK